MDKQTLLNIGKNNFVVVSRILSITTFEAAAIKRFVQNAKENGLVLNSTCGRKTRSAIVLDTGFVILSSIQPETLASRLKIKDSVKTHTKKLIDIELNNENDENENSGISDNNNKNKHGKKSIINKKGKGKESNIKIGKKNV